jgi:hypothetical protein
MGARGLEALIFKVQQALRLRPSWWASADEYAAHWPTLASVKPTSAVKAVIVRPISVHAGIAPRRFAPRTVAPT